MNLQENPSNCLCSMGFTSRYLSSDNFISSSKLTCLQCNTGYYDTKVDVSISTCSNSCSTFSISSFVCLPMSPQCLSLTNSSNYTDCLTCTTNLYKYNGTCIAICPSSWALNSTTGLCDLVCIVPCITCSVIGTNCTSCSNGT